LYFFFINIFIAHPIERVKEIVKKIIQCFVLSESLNDEEDFTWKKNIEDLINNDLYNELLTILNFGFKKGLFARYHLWMMIEEISEIKKISAIEIGGILLPTTVERVNKLVSKKPKIEDINDLKFRIFLFQSLRFYLFFLT
jgi:hypothetical protein